MDYLWIALGALGLYIGGEGLVRGASSLGRRFGLSHLVIGLTIVSCGTSTPELAACLAGVFSNAPAVAMAEKAVDMILEDARRGTGSVSVTSPGRAQTESVITSA